MSIKATLSSDGVEEVYTTPTLKEMCLYKCVTNKNILTKEVEVGEGSSSNYLVGKVDWEKFRLKEPVQKDLVEALLDAGEKFLFMLTPNYQPVLAAIRMSQPEHLVKIHVNNTTTLKDWQLELLLSGGNVKSLDIHGCDSLGTQSLIAINKFGNKLEYLRIGNSSRVLPHPRYWNENSVILRTPNLKTFIVRGIHYWDHAKMANYWRFLLQHFISNIEDLQIGSIGKLETLEFLEPARGKLSALTLRNCAVAETANAWASLFKLDKLRFLDMVGSPIGEALVGENVVQRLLAAMPNLTSLTVDPVLFKNISVDTSIRGQGSVAKRLEFLGIMGNNGNLTDLRTAKLLAKDVAYFGAVEGELRILEFYSNRLNVDAFKFNFTLRALLEIEGLNIASPCKTVTGINLIMKTFKNNGVTVDPEFLFQNFKTLFTPDVAAKLGEVLLDQCIGVIFANITNMNSCYEAYVAAKPEMISDIIDIIMNLEGRLRFDHYTTIVPMVMSMVEMAMATSTTWYSIDREQKRMLKKMAQLLKNAVDRFPGEINDLWEMPSVLGVITNLKDAMVSYDSDRFDLIEIFSEMIASLRKLCLNSGPRRDAFHSANGVNITMELLTEIIDGCLGLVDPVSFDLFDILQSILQDTKLNLSEPGMIASRLEKLLFSLDSKWEAWKSNPARGATLYDQMESIASLLNILESDPRYDYEASSDVKEIMVKIK